MSKRTFAGSRTEAFTLMEIMIILIVVATLAVLGLFGAQLMSEGSRARVCEANLKVLKNSLDLYMLDHDRMPQTLSQLPPAYLQRSLTAFLSEPGHWQERLAYWAVAREKQGCAYAAPFITDLAQVDTGIVTCPKDATPPPGGVSYGLHQSLQNMSARAYMELGPSQVLIGDCDSVTFTNAAALAKRHGGVGPLQAFSRGIRKDNAIVKH